ncbi:hypothetical protein [Siminovitchia fortis]|uniref:Uncharacterized protein n=1 Tax=Siminovitchia fortis TaxID=254758 RepID=A0A443J2A4_9BACI|nr:hypothetical protein [Siminovitchia fortis]RWR14607.1 hypothetical protein D4N35_002160 [Siminovitchia fortis]WHY80288.1 hypothetical protein QNH23_09885 [Siminovitchia fortis]
MKKKKLKDQFLPDSDHEGRDRYFMDVDRMENEGMSGGYVFMREDSTNIEQSTDFFPEDPPQDRME